MPGLDFILNVNVSLTGPFLDQSGADKIDRACDTIAHDLASQASSYVHQFCNESFRNPTPYYETQIQTQKVAEGYRVDDRGIVYGPWLEGVGSRNKTTRFKGYAMWRRGFQQIEREASQRAEESIRSTVDSLQ